MQTVQHSAVGKASIFSTLGERSKEKGVASEKTHCWYCNKPLSGYRRFCSKECEEAIYEDNDTARKRRLIFGCHC
jgi:predicted nucleic acid-binding Zn ribbon protein